MTDARTAQLRDRLRTALGRDVPDPIWELLDIDRYVEEALGDLDDFKGLVARTRLLLRILGEPLVPLKEEGPLESHLEAVSLELAKEASEQSNVVGFRSDILSGLLIPFAGVPRWVEDRLAEDGDPVPLLSLPVPAGHEIQHQEEAPELYLLSPPMTISRQIEGDVWKVTRVMLEYGAPGTGVMRRFVRPGGVLDRLRRLSEDLESAYRWQRAQATIFVLTGLPPILPAASVDVEYHGDGRGLTARIVLRVDASMSPAAVARVYRNARSTIPVPAARARRPMISEKHLELARFLSDHDPRPTWRKLLARWNSAHPEWKYAEDRWKNFARDSRHAFQRIFGDTKEAAND